MTNDRFDPPGTERAETGEPQENHRQMKEQLLREAQIEIQQMKEAAMEEIQSSTAAYVHFQVQQAVEAERVRFIAEEQNRAWLAEQNRICLAREQSRQFSRLGLTLFAFMGVTLAVQLALVAVTALWEAVGGREIDLDNPVILQLFSAVPMYLVAFPVTAALMQLIPKRGRTGRERWGSVPLLACIVISIGMGLLGNIMGRVVNLFGTPAGDVEQIDDMIRGAGMLVHIGMVVFAAPIVEELLFRKLLIDRIVGYGEGVAVLTSGLLFGLAHGNFSQFFFAAGIGALWAYVYVKTGNVGYTIAFHMLFNLLGGMVAVELSKGAMEIYDPAGLAARMELFFGVDFGPVFAVMCAILILLYLLFTFACMLGGAAILIVYRKRLRFGPGERPIAWGRRFHTVVFNVGMILYLAFCGWLFWLSF